jgi:hypothetical protein
METLRPVLFWTSSRGQTVYCVTVEDEQGLPFSIF